MLFFVCCAIEQNANLVTVFTFPHCQGWRARESKGRTERGRRTVVANMIIWIADSDIGGLPDRALGPGPAHEETLPWALAV